jgi:TorA maturation chaperone TorD
VRGKSYIKTFIDPDLRKEWRKFLKKFPYLFWVQAMNVKDEKEWRELVKGKEPDLNSKPYRPKNAAEFASITRARRDAYYHIARCFAEPSRAFVEELLNGGFADALEACLKPFVSESKTKDWLNLLRRYLITIRNQKIKKVLEGLRGEHLTIFYDSFFPWLSCYESVYRGEKQIMGDLTAMVKDSYRDAGFYLTGKYGNDPPDDAKIELEFMYRLCEEELEAWRRGDRNAALAYLEMQRKHLQEHLIEWIPYLCDDLLKPEFRDGVAKKFHRIPEAGRDEIREFDFYRAIAAITKATLECDHNQVEAMLDAGRELEVSEVSRELHDSKPLDVSTERFALEKSR